MTGSNISVVKVLGVDAMVGGRLRLEGCALSLGLDLLLLKFLVQLGGTDHAKISIFAWQVSLVLSSGNMAWWDIQGVGLRLIDVVDKLFDFVHLGAVRIWLSLDHGHLFWDLERCELNALAQMDVALFSEVGLLQRVLIIFGVLKLLSLAIIIDNLIV